MNEETRRRANWFHLFGRNKNWKTLQDSLLSVECLKNGSNYVLGLDGFHKATDSDRAADDSAEFGWRQCSQSPCGFVELAKQQE